jgi:hypothetical protein
MSLLTTFATSGTSQELLNDALTSAYRNFSRIYDPSVALQREPDIWEKILRDADFSVAINDRLNNVAGRDWQFEPATDTDEDKAAAELATYSFGKIGNFTMARRGLATGVFRGRAFRKLEGDRLLIAPVIGGRQLDPMLWWCPMRLKDADPNRYAYRPVRWIDPETNQERVRVIAQQWNVVSGRWEDWTDYEQYVKVVFSDEEARVGYGRSLVEAAYFYWWFKGIVLKEGVAAIQRWARGLLIASVDASAPGGTDRTSEDVRDDMLTAIEDGRERHAIAIDKNDKIEQLMPSPEGWKMVMDGIRLANDAVTRLFSGSLRPTGGGTGATGARAQAETESDTSESLRQFDREVIDEAITRDALGLFWRVNWPNLVKSGLAGANKPKFRTMQKKARDPRAEADINEIALRSGMSLDADDAYQVIGRKRPKPGDDTIEPRPVAAPALPFRN